MQKVREEKVLYAPVGHIGEGGGCSFTSPMFVAGIIHQT